MPNLTASQASSSMSKPNLSKKRRQRYGDKRVEKSIKSQYVEGKMRPVVSKPVYTPSVRQISTRYLEDCARTILSPGSVKAPIFPTPDTSVTLDTRHFWTEGTFGSQNFFGDANDILIAVNPNTSSTALVTAPGASHPPAAIATNGNITIQGSLAISSGVLATTQGNITFADCEWPGIDQCAVKPTPYQGYNNAIIVAGNGVFGPHAGSCSITFPPDSYSPGRIHIQLLAYIDADFAWSTIGEYVGEAKNGNSYTFDGLDTAGQSFSGLAFSLDSDSSSIKAGTLKFSFTFNGMTYATNAASTGSLNVIQQSAAISAALNMESTRVVALSYLLSCKADALHNGGSIFAARVPSGSLSSLDFTNADTLQSTMSTLDPKYTDLTGRFEKGSYGFWLPQKPSETQLTPPSPSLSDETRFIILLRGLSSEASFTLRLDLQMEFHSDSQYFDRIPSPIINERWTVLIRMLNSVNCFAENPNHPQFIDKLSALADKALNHAMDFVLSHPDLVYEAGSAILAALL